MVHRNIHFLLFSFLALFFFKRFNSTGVFCLIFSPVPKNAVDLFNSQFEIKASGMQNLLMHCLRTYWSAGVVASEHYKQRRHLLKVVIASQANINMDYL